METIILTNQYDGFNLKLSRLNGRYKVKLSHNNNPLNGLDTWSSELAFRHFDLMKKKMLRLLFSNRLN